MYLKGIKRIKRDARKDSFLDKTTSLNLIKCAISVKSQKDILNEDGSINMEKLKQLKKNKLKELNTPEVNYDSYKTILMYRNKLGIDPETSKSLIYPINMPKRNYQLESVREGVMRNTFITIPTGMGKTFIANVLIYNFIRWFPNKKCVFFAPTKPLVTQQYNTFKNLFGKDIDEIGLVHGEIEPKERKLLWENSKVIFCTGHIFCYELFAGRTFLDEYILAVFDEAHHANGYHCYGVIAEAMKNYPVRIIGISAAGAGSIRKLTNVLGNMKIEKFIHYKESDIDIKAHSFELKTYTFCFSHSKSFEKFFGLVCSILWRSVFENIPMFMRRYYSLDDPSDRIYKKLSDFSSLFCSQDETKGAFFSKSGISLILKSKILLVLLKRYGYGAFFTYIDMSFASSKEISEIFNKSCEFMEVYNDYKKCDLVYNSQEVQSLERFNLLEKYTHPKLSKLFSVLLNHFKHFDDSTRVLIFSTYKTSVIEIVRRLKIFSPNIRPMWILGQQASHGIPSQSQKEQQQVLKDFGAGKYNVLVSTSVAEEGLDIGLIDLVICYDTSIHNISYIQRIGRAARKRSGYAVHFVMEGDEHESYESVRINYRVLQNKMSDALNSIELANSVKFFVQNNFEIVFKHL